MKKQPWSSQNKPKLAKKKPARRPKPAGSDSEKPQFQADKIAAKMLADRDSDGM